MICLGWSLISAEQYVKNLFNQGSERDRQRMIGASNMSSACTRCLADDMLQVTRPQGVYDMGKEVGTAIHAYLEDRNRDWYALPERKVVIGTIEGYGEISSTTDLVRIDPDTGGVHIVDFKTTARDKLSWYRAVVQQDPEFDSPLQAKARWTLSQYFRQAQLYALGVHNTLHMEPAQVDIVFVCRDGQIVDRDIWGHSMPYDPALAETTFNRAAKLWEWLQTSGNDPDDLPSQEHCYYCSVVRSDNTPEVEL